MDLAVGGIRCLRTPNAFTTRSVVALAAAGILLLAQTGSALAATPTFGSGSDSDLAKMLSDVGFSGDKLVLALEIVFAESGANPRAKNPSGARGIFQFMPNTLADDNCAYDPVCASMKAYEITKGGLDWRKWETFTTGVYQRYSTRAEAAIRGANITSTATVAVLPGLDLQKMAYQTTANLLYGVDQLLISEMEKLWNPMVTGTDDLTGTSNFGALLVVDNSRLQSMWSISLGIATGSLLVLILMLTVVIWMLRAATGLRHDLPRNLVYFFATVIVMATSFFLITQVIDVDNALVSAVSGQVAVELHSLPAFQHLALPNPNTIQAADQLLTAISILLLGLVIGLELLFLFALYFMRLILIWVLVVLAPFALAVGILPGARGIAIYWARLLMAVIFMKFVNVLIFTTFVLIAAASSAALFNVILVFTMLFLMILVPLTLFRAMVDPDLAAGLVHQSWSRTTRAVPLRAVGGRLWSQIRR